MNTALVDLIRTLVAVRLKRAPSTISVDEDFANLGLVSLDAVILSGLLEEKLGVPVDPVIFLDNRTIAAAARAIALD